MQKHDLPDLLQESPIVASVKDETSLEQCLKSDCKIVFVLFGTVLSIPNMVARIKAAGKFTLVHVDLIDGLAARDIAVDFIAKNTQADGIISTKSNLVRHAKSLGLFAVQRFFLLDSIALVNISKQLPLETADAIEILPGVMPKIIAKVTSFTQAPVIAGGLIADKEDVVNALSAGAVAVSSTNPDVWFL